MRAFSLILALAALSVSAAPAAPQSLYWLDTNYGAPTLNRGSVDGTSAVSVPLSAGTLPEGLAVEANGRAYIAEAAWSNARVDRVGFDLTSVFPIETGGSSLRGIAVDQANQLLYWTSSNLVAGATISRSGTGGGPVTTLITLPAGANPRGIAVDPVGGKLYWADFDLNAIYRANLDGSGMALWQTLASGAAPYGIAVDPGHQFVFWTEYNGGRLERAFIGGGAPIILLSGLANPTYIAADVANQRVYWVESGVGAQRIGRATMNGLLSIYLPPTLATYGGVAFAAGSLTGAPDPGLPIAFSIDVWPMPARGSVHIAFALPRASAVQLGVYDLQGREVFKIADGSLPAGRYDRPWDGGALPSGLYFARLTVDSHHWTRRMVLAR